MDEEAFLKELETFIARRRAERERQEAIAAFLEKPFPREVRALARFFAGYGLLLHKWGTGKPPGDYGLAKTVWAGYDVLAPFLRETVRQVNLHAETFLYPPLPGKPLPKRDKGRLLTFCAALERKGTLVALKEGDRLLVEVRARDTKFINGGWGERVTLYLVDRTLKTFTRGRHLPHRLFWNVRLLEPGSEQTRMELDVVAQVGERFYIFETKTGETLDVEKWVARSRRFGDGRSAFLTCTPRDEINPKYFQPCVLLPFSRLEEIFSAMLLRDFPPTPETPVSDRMGEPSPPTGHGERPAAPPASD